MVGGNSLTNPANFYVEVDKDGLLLSGKRQPAKCIYQDFDIANDGSVYFSAQYTDTFSFGGQLIDTTKAKQGVAIFKYDKNGSEAWSKYIVLYTDYSIPYPPLPPLKSSMQIEYFRY